MPAQIPPWLNVQPAQFLAAREAGDQTRLHEAGLGIESARVNLESRAQGNRMAVAAAEHELNKQALDQSEQRLRQAEQAHTVEQRQNQLKIDLEAQEAARSFQNIQQRQSAVQGFINEGMSPESAAIKAAAMFPGAHESIDPFVRSQESNEATVPIYGEDGETVIGYKGKNFHALPATAYAPDRTYDLTQGRINQLLNLRDSTAAHISQYGDESGTQKQTLDWVDKQLSGLGAIPEQAKSSGTGNAQYIYDESSGTIKPIAK